MTQAAPRPAPSTVLISEAALATLVAHARRCYPHEACGLVAVDAQGLVVAAYPVENVAASPVRFTLDPAGHYAAATDAERNGWEIGGLFHSHPDGAAVPSPTDSAPAEDWVQVIIGFVPDVHVRAWDVRMSELALLATEELAEPGPEA